MRIRFMTIIAVVRAAMLLAAGARAQKVAAAYGQGPGKFSLATGSPGELSLLQALGEAFGEKNGR